VFQVQDQAPEHCGERFFKDAISSEAAPHVAADPLRIYHILEQRTRQTREYESSFKLTCDPDQPFCCSL
jgi:hypothetical protein